MSYIYADIAIFKCPCCGKKIEVSRIQPFGERLFARKPFACPHCRAELIWAMTPFRVFNGGVLLFLFSFVLAFFAKARFLTFPVLFVGCILMVIGMLTQRLTRHSRS